jgi:hypothetical protein
MKYLLLIAALSLPFAFPLGHPVNEALYTLTTDCNGYSPLSLNFYKLECDI